MGTFLLFVYGTLKRGGCRHGPLASQGYRGEARTRPLYALHHFGEHPGLVGSAEGGQVVHGELYEVECALLPALDEMEGAPGWFNLGAIEIEEICDPVWTYFYQGDPGAMPRIESGRWEIGP
jgi:gamma-glutamylcyclotransferase (GGCT)/AIG2-like uncharacterized protein YtfP